MPTISNKWNTTLLYFAISYLLINTAFFVHLNILDMGSGLIYIFIFPIFWFIYITIVAIFAYKNKTILFIPERKNASIFLILFCTPISILIIVKIISLFMLTIIDPIIHNF